MKRYLLLIACLFIAACGFKPVHASLDSNLQDQLASIEIAPIEGRSGQVLKYKLSDLLTPDSGKTGGQYVLDIVLTSEKRELGIQENLRVTRYDIVQTANYSLKNAVNGTELTKGKATIKSSFNRTESEFSAYVAEEDANKKAAEELAGELKQRLVAYFSQQ